MKIILAAPRGFCAGVNMAIESLDLAIRAFGTPIENGISVEEYFSSPLHPHRVPRSAAGCRLRKPGTWTMRVRSTLAPVADFDGDGVPDAIDAAPYDPARH